MDRIVVSFDNNTIIDTRTTDHIVNWAGDFSSIQSSDSRFEIVFSFKNFLNEPDRRIVTLGNSLEVGEERISFSGGLGNTEFTGLDTGVEEDGTSETVNTEDVFTLSEIIDGHCQVGEISEEFKVEVSAMINGTVIISSDNTGAGPPGGEFVHEVQGEESVEREVTQFRDGFDLFNVLLVLKDSLSVEGKDIVDKLGDGK